MNYNQNKKIAQITSQTLIIGVDIAKFKHVARAQDFRGIEFGSPCYWLIRRISKKDEYRIYCAKGLRPVPLERPASTTWIGVSKE